MIARAGSGNSISTSFQAFFPGSGRTWTSLTLESYRRISTPEDREICRCTDVDTDRRKSSWPSPGERYLLNTRYENHRVQVVFTSVGSSRDLVHITSARQYHHCLINLWMDVHSNTPSPKRGREFRAWVTPPLFQHEGWAVEYTPYNARRYSTAVADEVLWDLAMMVDSFGREGSGMREGVVDVRVVAGNM